MWQQKSFNDQEDNGTLFLVPTPIGNLEDISFRAVRILKEVDLIAAEDTRNTKKLCHYYKIETPIVSYHEHNKETSGKKLLEKISDGMKIALVSDAGMPTISDPGFELVAELLENKLSVVPLPGANAALTALIASGLPPQPFYFYGFLNRQKREKKKELEELKKLTVTFILYESPHRLKETLALILEVLGDRRLVLSRELTKKYEEFIRGSVSELLNWSNTEEIRGEFCLIVEGSSKAVESDQIWWGSLTVKEHVQHYMEKERLSSKEAIKKTAKERGIQKREVYQIYHIHSDY